LNCEHLHRVVDAWLDGELDDGTNAEALAHAATCQRCAALRASRERLRFDLQTVARYEAPAHLRRSIRTAMKNMEAGGQRARQALRVPLWPAIAVLASVSAFAFFVGWRLGGLSTPPDRLEPVVALHVASLNPADRLVQVASSDRHTVKPFFAGKLPFAPPVRDLRADGFSLIGGRIDDLDGQPAAAIVYRIREHVINLVVTSAGTASRPVTVSSLRGFSMVAWRADGLALTAVSDVDSAELQRFARLVQSP